MGEVFFSIRPLGFQLGQLLGQIDKVIGQLLEEPIIIYLLLDDGGVIGGNSFRTFLALVEALQDEIRTGLNRFAALQFTKELLAKGAAAQAVNLAHLLEDGLALGKHLIKVVVRDVTVSTWIQYFKQKRTRPWPC